MDKKYVTWDNARKGSFVKIGKHADRILCGRTSGGYTCTRSKNHSGQHVATDRSGRVVYTWRDKAEEEKPSDSKGGRYLPLIYLKNFSDLSLDEFVIEWEVYDYGFGR